MGTVTAREFNRSPSSVKEMAKREPVVVTERGKPALVILSVAEYERLVGRTTTYDLFRMADDVEIDFEPVVSSEPVRPAEL